jgi:hypothetical protein
MKSRNWTKEEHDYLRVNYVEQGSVIIGKKLDRNPKAVACMANYFGLKRGRGNDVRYRKYSVNSDIFKTWTRESAYLVGLILTDGNIGEREFNIVSKDIELLEKSKKALEAEHPITKQNNWFRLRIGHKAMVSDLKRIGITERKSLTATLPKIPDEFFFDFLRGYVDGDGMIKFKKGIILNLCTASPYILDDISKTITRLLLVDKHEVKKTMDKRGEKISTMYNLVYCGQCAVTICGYMYAHANNLFLSRKYQNFIDYVNRPLTSGWRNNGNATKYKSN